MPSNSVLSPYEDVIRWLVENENYTHSQVVSYLKGNYGLQRGCSQRNLQDFCSERDIHRFDTRRHSREQILETVRGLVNEVGPTYGRRMLTGLLRSRGQRIGERATSAALQRINPNYHLQRQRGTERLRNPTPYFAEYAGHKLHMDQNEKLAEFGVTHVIASDGYSGKIVGASSMPVKNNVTIYDEVYRPACTQYGLWDQVRVDHGREFYLVLYQQDCMRNHRTNTQRQPFVQTQSKQNHIAERVWVEVNHRSTYPMKRVLVGMKGRDMLNMDDEYWKGCISQFLLSVCRVSIQNVIDAWNSRSIPGKGIPEIRFSTNFRCSPISPIQLPTGYQAMQEYTNLGGQITQFSPFGSDVLENDIHAREQRDQEFFSRFQSFENIAHAIANNQEALFEQALLHYVDLTLYANSTSV